jgi:hypothetical protein
MSKRLKEIDAELGAWIGAQRLFFVATAPLSQHGHINVSPKGGEAFRILGPTEIAYQDYTGSGAETIAHLRENGCIVVMFCAFDGPPKIVRLHGSGRAISAEHPDFPEILRHFPDNPGTRSIIHIQIDRVSSSCGYSVPFYEFRGARPTLDEWAMAKGPDKLAAYRSEKNAKSIDGLPALDIRV